MANNDEVMTKKCRIWNPALDDCYNVTRNNDKNTISVNFQNDYVSQVVEKYSFHHLSFLNYDSISSFITIHWLIRKND